MCGGPDPFQAVGDALASVDPGPTIGGGLASLDSTVSQNVPGGWGTLAALAAAIATAGSSIPASEAAFMAADAGNLAAQGLTQEAIAQNLAASYGISASDAAAAAAATNAGAAEAFAQTGTLNPDYFAGLSANAPVDTTLSQEAAASMGAGAGAGAGAGSGSATGSLGSLSDPSLTTQIGGPSTSTGSFGSFTGSGGGVGLTGQLPADVMVGDGTLGTTMGQTYMSAGPGQFALDAAGNAIPASSIGIDGFAPTSSLSLSDLNNARKVAQALGSTGAAKSLLTSPTGTTAATGAASTGTNTGAASKIYETPKATLVHGEQIAIPGMTGIDTALPTQQAQNLNPLDLQLIQQAKDGGMIYKAGGGNLPMQETRMRGRQFTPYQANTGLNFSQHRANGGEIEGHNPTFFSPGGLASMENTYVSGEGDGTSDSVAAMLADGEFVIPADVVSKLGNGSSNAGAKVLDNFLLTIREHAQKHDPKNLPPDSKGALAYLLDANKKVRA